MRFTRLAGINSMNAYVAPASVEFDNANSAVGTTVANLTTSSWTIAGSNRVLIAGMGWSGGGPPTYSTIKWEGSGGTALTQHGSTFAVLGTRRAIARLIAPNATSGTLYGELSGAADEFCLGGVSVTNADQTTPLGTAVTNSATSASSPATAQASGISANSNDMLIDMAYATMSSPSTLTVVNGEGGTMRWERESIGSFTCGTQSTRRAVTSVISEIYTAGSGSIDWGIIGVAIKSSG